MWPADEHESFFELEEILSLAGLMSSFDLGSTVTPECVELEVQQCVGSFSTPIVIITTPETQNTLKQMMQGHTSYEPILSLFQSSCSRALQLGKSSAVIPHLGFRVRR